jgi:glucose-6-phosphate-specific signal transduction histidine kinase
VRDNGKGITEAEMANPQSLGLLGMKERAALLGGEVVFNRDPGQGTIVTVRIPMSAALFRQRQTCMIRVLIVDDHEITRRGLKQILPMRSRKYRSARPKIRRPRWNCS